MWSVEFFDAVVLKEMQQQPNDIKAKFEHIVKLIEANGLCAGPRALYQTS